MNLKDNLRSYRLTLVKFSVGTKRQPRGTAEKSQAPVQRLKFVSVNKCQTELPKYVILTVFRPVTTGCTWVKYERAESESPSPYTMRTQKMKMFPLTWGWGGPPGTPTQSLSAFVLPTHLRLDLKWSSLSSSVLHPYHITPANLILNQWS
jgi:hypothetical protein